MKERILAVDIGGTKTSLMLAGPGSSREPVLTMPTEGDREPRELVREIVRAARNLPGWTARRVELVATGFPGALDPCSGRVRFAPNLRGWENLVPGDLLGEAFGCPVLVENDAGLATLAEWKLGAGSGCDDFVYITVSTGVGAGVVAGGRLLRGSGGLAGEVGHMILDPGGEPCGCGRRGCLETLASGPALARKARAYLSAGENSILGPDPDPPEILSAFRGGDPLAVRLIQELAGWLALGIHNLDVTVNPARVALGGGLGLADPAILQLTRRALENLRPQGQEAPLLMPAALGSAAVLEGALVLAGDPIKKPDDPGVPDQKD